MSERGSAGDRVRDVYRGERAREYYLEFAQDEHAKAAIARNRARKIQPHVPRDASVLEYGVGAGYNLRYLECREKWGFDLSEAIREDAERAGVSLVHDLGDLRGRTFDVVLCHHVLEHVPDPLSALDEMKRLIAPGGRLLLHVPFETRRRYRRFVARDPTHHLYSWNAQTLGNLLEHAGYDVVETRIQGYAYERRLAPLARAGDGLYRLGLLVLRSLRREDEVLAVARPSGS